MIVTDPKLCFPSISSWGPMLAHKRKHDVCIEVTMCLYSHNFEGHMDVAVPPSC